MSTQTTTNPARQSSTWLPEWNPEDNHFWETKGKKIAYKTLAITTLNLMLAFITWFLVSVLVVRLSKTGFKFTKSELFWFTAMPGLAAGTLRIIHMFLTPKFGTRHVVSISSALLVIPLVGWYYAVQDPDTSFATFMVLAFLVGLGGGNFSSFMPSTSLFFPKRLQGTALGIQAGIGNFGVSLVQFITPWVIGFSLAGSAQATKAGGSLWLQNAPLIWIPFVVVFSIIAWFGLKSVPVRANMSEQLDIFGEKHTWSMTSLYIMTFGSFAGFATIFPLLIKNQFGGFENAPDPLTYAFVGPLVGSLLRVIAGPVSDKFGGARVTQLSGVGLLFSAIGVTFFAQPDSMSDFTPFVIFMVAIFFFAGIGNASTFKQIPMLFDPRKAAGVIGWTAAIAAYTPFVFAFLLAQKVDLVSFFIGVAAFYAINIFLNWFYFARKGAESPC